MKAGTLDRRVTMQRLTTGTPDEYGVPSETWNDLRTVWARVTPDSEDEKYQLGVDLAFVLVKVQCRWFAGLITTDRLVIDGRVFDIRGVREIGRREGLEIKAKAPGVAL
ncbi:phage head closure protein [Pleomorphomonas carboxyditropha]|uniref:Head-tail adaptor protein n=1 Tax=Pleomorphomonas carboxyditropha TaxID=2023338 RepID=A0A2G9WY72_9HYPH|nr:phage head closure protein [Pleomorphomonas carboxyditropha]PIO99657.1 hypothetical protein CJ014_10155 [Pleomorphomonas carboxyditropha]